jgi:hypothetical protein
VESHRPNILELCTVFARPDIKVAWDLHIHDILEAAAEEGVVNSAAHVQIRALYNKKHNAKAPPRTNISYIIMPAMSLLNRIDSDHPRSVLRPYMTTWRESKLCSPILPSLKLTHLIWTQKPTLSCTNRSTFWSHWKEDGQVGKLEVHVRGLLQQRSLRTQHADGTSV